MHDSFFWNYDSTSRYDSYHFGPQNLFSIKTSPTCPSPCFENCQHCNKTPGFFVGIAKLVKLLVDFYNRSAPHALFVFCSPNSSKARFDAEFRIKSIFFPYRVKRRGLARLEVTHIIARTECSTAITQKLNGLSVDFSQQSKLFMQTLFCKVPNRYLPVFLSHFSNYTF